MSKAEIIASGSYDLSLNRYKKARHEEESYVDPKNIIADPRTLEDEIAAGARLQREMGKRDLFGEKDVYFALFNTQEQGGGQPDVRGQILTKHHLRRYAVFADI